MITCKECGKTNGHSAVGTSWICEDCKVVYEEQKQAEPDDKLKSHQPGQPDDRK
ncbi:hypothetical protein [Paenibacillus silvisoli]|uniref:hypothetical protein n=1 Tax=Paenibacillus silvisoli TaxID=3110539 RepID=UPI002806229C|nr:hypothetical protein [Paenibacillus silvisoli]